MISWLRYQWQRYLAWALRDRCPLPSDWQTMDSASPISSAYLGKINREEALLRHYQARFNEIEARTQVELRRRQ